MWRNYINLKNRAGMIVLLIVMLAGLAVMGERPASAAARLSKSGVKLSVGKKKKIKLKGVDAATSKTVQWQCSDKAVAKIKVAKNNKSVKVKAKKKGLAIVRAKAGGKYLYCLVKVGKSLRCNSTTAAWLKEMNDRPVKTQKTQIQAEKQTETAKPAYSYEFSIKGKKKIELYINHEYTFDYYAKTDDPNPPELKATFTDTAPICADGNKLTAIMPGTTTITYTYGTASDSIEVTVLNPGYDPTDWKDSYTIAGDEVLHLVLPTMANAGQFTFKIEEKGSKREDVKHPESYGGATDYYFKGGRRGQAIFNIYMDGQPILKTTITVTSDSKLARQWDDWCNKVKAQIWKTGMSEEEKLQAFGDYLCANYDYSIYYQSYVAILNGKGGDCWAYADLVSKFARTEMGLEAFPCQVTYGITPTHKAANIKLSNGKGIIVEAGFIGTAPRAGGKCIIYSSDYMLDEVKKYFGIS